MPKDWNMLHWIFRQAIKPRRIACLLFAGVVLIDLRIYLGIEYLGIEKELPFVVFSSLVLLLLLYATSYRSSGKWYDWKDADLDEWKYIKEILMLEREVLDPLRKPPSWHSVWCKDELGQLIFWVAVISFMCRWGIDKPSPIDWLLGWVTEALNAGEEAPLNAGEKETTSAGKKDSNGSYGYVPVVLAALIAATATVIAIFLTVRQNTRSTNREAWNDTVRKLVASLIAGVPRSYVELADARKRHQLQYFKLALYLNPSEKAHRGLLYAVAVMYGAEKDWLARGCPDSELVSFNRDRGSLERRVQGITRLSNVVFKTEWERVKRLT